MTRALELRTLARAANAETRGGPLPDNVSAVGTDTRSLPPACLFVALRGERFDGHRFVREAVDRGARAVLVDREGDTGLNDLAVPRLVAQDTLTALGEMAAAERRRVGKPVVAVTGSNGKTTTKEMVAAALGGARQVHKTAGNLNNLIGLPLTVLGWPEQAWAAVLEMGMSAPGEIARLTDIAAPQVGVVTNVAPAHLLGLGDLAGVARAKAELYAGLAEEAVAVVNADDPSVTAICVPFIKAARTLRFGTRPGCDVRVQHCQSLTDGLRVTLEVQGAVHRLRLPLHGGHNALNAAAAMAAAVALRLPVDDIVAGLERVQLPGGRLRVLHDVPGGLGVIDDTYNANPDSMRAALATLGDLAGNGRRVAVLGDMLELGAAAAELHHGVGQAAAAAGVGWLLALGEHGVHMCDGARQGGVARAEAFASKDALLRALRADLRAGDWILVKGSRGMRMEELVAAIAGGDG